MTKDNWVKQEKIDQNQAWFKRAQVAARWGCSVRKIDRLREKGLLKWIDLTGKQGRKPVVRFSLDQILEFEKQCIMNFGDNKGV